MTRVEVAKSEKRNMGAVYSNQQLSSSFRAVRFFEHFQILICAGKNDDFGMSPPAKLRRSKTVEQTYQKKTQAPETCILDVALMSKDVNMAIRFCRIAFEITG